MEKLRFFRSVCSWGDVIFTIFKVLSMIAAVLCLLGVLFLSFLPAGLVKMDTRVKVDMEIAMEKVFGESWTELYEDFSPSDFGMTEEEATVSKEGISISQSAEGFSLDNRAISLVLVPSFAGYLISFFLYGCIAKVFHRFKTTAEPLRAPVHGEFRRMGWLMMALGSVPGVCASLITFITDTQGLVEAEYNLFLLFAGFLVWALGDLLEHAASHLPPVFQSSYPQDPGSSASSGFDPNAF